MGWRGLQQWVAAFWKKLPKPVRQLLSVVLVFWRVLGWIEDHVARLILLIIIIGALAAGGALVIGVYLSEVDPLWIYIGVLGSIAVLIWGAAGVATLMQASIPAFSASATTEPVAEEPKAEEDDVGRVIRQMDARTFEGKRLSDLLEDASMKLAAGVLPTAVFPDKFKAPRMATTALADLKLYEIIENRAVMRPNPHNLVILTGFGKRVVMALRDRGEGADIAGDDSGG